MTSRAKTWGCATLAVLGVAGTIAYWVYSQPRTYAHFTLYSDTSLVNNDRPTGWVWVYREKPGHQTLVIERGEDYTHQYTDWWHREGLILEFDSPLVVGRPDLATGVVRLGYWFAAWTNHCSGIEKQGVQGWIDIESVGEAGVVVRYDITVDSRYDMTGTTRTVQFRGRSTFKNEPRPENDAYGLGSLYPE
jgi:hypothetical protein